MPIYKLWRQTDDKTFDADARDDQHALAVFGQLLGVALTLKEGHAAPEFMMARVEKGAHWVKPPDIPVWLSN